MKRDKKRKKKIVFRFLVKKSQEGRDYEIY